MKIAYLCEPQLGGTFTFFLRLREGMKSRGVDVRCIPPYSGENFDGTRFAGLEGVEYLRFPDDPAAATGVIIERLVAEKYDAVVTLPGCDILTTNIVRYLPHSIRTIARIPMATLGAYRPVRPIANWLDRVVCLCDRIQTEILSGYSVERVQTVVIPNGANLQRFQPEGRRSPNAPGLRMLYAGRLEDVQKNIMLLPQVIERLRDRIPGLRLTIAGTGPDGERLMNALNQIRGAAEVELKTRIMANDMPEFCRDADIFVFPTRFEGSPNALLEAMAAGCVPVATQIAGCTDSIIEQGKSGFLCRVDDARECADRVFELSQNRELLAKMSAAAHERIAASFTLDQMVSRWHALLKQTCEASPKRAEPLDVTHYAVPRGLKRGWQGWIPAGLKKRARTILTRLGKSV